MGVNPLTGEGVIIGTFHYMSPEQIEGKDADSRSDIFALGAVLYEMTTGKRAFEGKTMASIAAAVIASEPKPVSALQPLSPPALEHVITQCLMKDPDERWQSALDLQRELKWIQVAGSQAGTASPIVARRKRRMRIAWGAAVLFALLARMAAGMLLALRQAGVQPHRRAESSGGVSSRHAERIAGTFSRWSEIGFRGSWPGRGSAAVVAFFEWTGPAANVGHRGGDLSLLVAGQQVDRIFRRQEAEEDRCLHRHSADSVQCSGGARRAAWNDKGVIVFSPGLSDRALPGFRHGWNADADHQRRQEVFPPLAAVPSRRAARTFLFRLGNKRKGKRNLQRRSRDQEDKASRFRTERGALRGGIPGVSARRQSDGTAV